MPYRYGMPPKPDNIACTKCAVIKPYTEAFFHPRKGHGWGLARQCRKCIIQRKKILEDGKFAHASIKKIAKNRHIIRKLCQIRDAGACEICSDTIAEATLVIDHCHTTNEIRGILCTACNRGIGYFEDNPLLLKQAMVYLEKEERPLMQLVKGG